MSIKVLYECYTKVNYDHYCNQCNQWRKVGVRIAGRQLAGCSLCTEHRSFLGAPAIFQLTAYT